MRGLLAAPLLLALALSPQALGATPQGHPINPAVSQYVAFGASPRGSISLVVAAELGQAHDDLWKVPLADPLRGMVKLTSGQADEDRPSASRDGRWLVYTDNREGPTALVARRMVRPLSALTSAAAAMASGRGTPHVNEEGPADVRNAAAAFNAMASKVNRTMESQRHLLADATERGRYHPADPARPEAGSGYIVLAMGKMGSGELNY